MKLLPSFLSFFFLILPFQFALSPVEGVDLSSIRLIAILLFFWWLTTSLFQRTIWLPEILPFFLITGFLSIAGASLLWAENPLFGLRKAAFLFSFYPLFFVLCAIFHKEPSYVLRILRAFVLGAAGAASVGLVFFFSQFVFGVERIFTFLTQTTLPFFLGETFAQSVAAYPSLLVDLSGVTVLRASGIFPDPHMFAFYLGMAAPWALVFFLRASSHGRFVQGSIFSVILLADLLSFSRGGYVGLVFGFSFFLFGSGILKRFSRKQFVAVIVLGVLLISGVFMSPIGERFLSSFSQADGSNRERLRLFGEAWEHLTEHPFFGVGLGNYPLLVVPTATYRDPIYVHNLFLDIAVEVGLLGLFFFVGLFLFVFYQVLVSWKKEPSHWFSLGLLSSLFVFLGHAFFETPLFSVHVLPVLLLLLSVGVSYRYEFSQTQ